MNTHEIYIQRCLQIAQNGLGQVAPNPLVGCVMVCDDQIIAEGFHQKYGENHAERNAISLVNDERLLKKSTLYVNLEPCSHFGKTPPCADLIIEKKIPKVVISNLDSNPEVARKGVERLRNAGIEVITGVLENEGRFLNRRFFTYIEKKRPYIILKWAQSLDGFMYNETERWITNDAMRNLVHKWRSEEPAIMVGTNTVLTDNPKLNVRACFGKNPLRITMDKNHKLPKNLHFFDHSQPTKIYETTDLSEILNDLYARKIQSLIVEGGAKLLQSFIEKNLWDETRILIGNKHLHNGLKAPKIQGKEIFSTEIEQDKAVYLFTYS
ncbi:MAG: bifunctional diaminohydroxyphosphoribosylaminopyrimidine deaminase/5-amino-6-(5-phosphoribosylamino)uracil reductase RibD [Bacteroidales bacterium]|nr:bifunctional diaminohydroxyphosphoribosylaminopyrimidine deaminase/5-amino-6-(5-phosphoribosylamino)uracil reductase RibD [Bacteroidales bacterium]